jgi:hypothetical protein
MNKTTFVLPQFILSILESAIESRISYIDGLIIEECKDEEKIEKSRQILKTYIDLQASINVDEEIFIDTELLISILKDCLIRDIGLYESCFENGELDSEDSEFAVMQMKKIGNEKFILKMISEE